MEQPILIQGAMKVETKCLIDNLQNCQKHLINGYEFYEGRLNDVHAVIGITKVASINAAVSTILGINKFHPKCIINQGVAGGYLDCIHRGDIVLGNFAINMNSYQTKEHKDGEGIHPEEWKFVSWNEDNDIEKEKLVADINLLSKAKDFLEKNYNKNLFIGTIASGDGWNKETDRIKWFAKEIEALCEDMETYAVYKVCYDNNVPVLGVRIISNNQINNESYDRNLSNILQEYLIKFISKLKI